MSKKFEGKIAVVTGGSAVMGMATAKRFVEEGMDQVFVTGRGKRRAGCRRRNWKERDGRTGRRG
jgi:NAD(P)-dependent dehydrogenase (short-subunit alcohol dehydrogenase family)